MAFIAQACSSFVEARQGLSMKACELMKYLQVVQTLGNGIVKYKDDRMSDQIW